MKISVVVPVHNEEKCIEPVLKKLITELEANKIEYEIAAVNDNSVDSSGQILHNLARIHARLRVINTTPPNGFGRAIRAGLENAQGQVVVLFMGDGSDDAKDVVKYYDKILEGYDCVFGSRFIKGSKVNGYPKLKFILNRLGNKLIQLLFLTRYNDVSNAFKAYRMEVVKAIQPLVSEHFNITVEMPLKAINRGFSFAVVPINWYGRDSGVSKYHLRQLSHRYLSSILSIWWQSRQIHLLTNLKKCV